MSDTPHKGAQHPKGGRIQVGIVVSDLARMTDFYTDILGLTYFRDVPFSGGPSFGGGTVKMLVLGDAAIKLMSFDEPPRLAIPPGGIGGGASGLRYVTVEVDSVAATVDRCAAAGCSVPIPPFEFEKGAPVAVVEDPEGNWVELIQGVR
jgi:catechol 2,3-dioxygenase-like lactoylglutathione lyase family enzyme